MYYTRRKKIQEQARLGGEGDLLGIAQETEILPYKWNMNKVEFFLENETLEIFWDFETKTDHPIPARRSHPVLIRKKKENLSCIDFAVSE